jgi:hypothetical protein
METELGKRSKPYTPTKFLMELSKLTKGSYYGLNIEKEVEKKMVVEGKPED